MPDIEPCPWCGEKARCRSRHDVIAGTRKCFVCCENDECGGGPHRDSEAEAVAAWNGVVRARGVMSAQTSAETWCPQCGPGVPFNEDGCCGMCGTTCTGPGAEQALDSVKRIAELEGQLRSKQQEFESVLTQEYEACPEGVSFPDHIRSLERRVAQLEREAKAVVAYLRWCAHMDDDYMSSKTMGSLANTFMHRQHVKALDHGDLDEWMREE